MTGVLRVATANLLHGRDVRSGAVLETDLRATARALDADVVGLQEVDRFQERSGHVDQTAVVADELAAGEWRFAPALHGAPGGADPWSGGRRKVGRFHGGEGAAYGIGLITRLPVLAWHVWTFPPARMALPLAVPGRKRVRLRWVADEPRVALAAVVESSAGPLTVATAHLSFVPGANVRQLRRLTRALRQLPGPHILFGDFNLPGRLPGRATGWQQLARVRTYPVWKPRVQFDHVMSDGDVRCVEQEAVPLPVSDHLGLRVTLRVVR